LGQRNFPGHEMDVIDHSHNGESMGFVGLPLGWLREQHPMGFFRMECEKKNTSNLLIFNDPVNKTRPLPFGGFVPGMECNVSKEKGDGK